MSKRPYCPILFLSASLAVVGALRADCDGTSYGAGVSIAEPTAIAAIVAAPESYVGKEVRVEGTVKEVCEMAGCWMELVASDTSGEAAGSPELKVKVKDGEIVFPVAARGKEAMAQGKVERLEMSRDKYVKHQKHLAKEQGRTFDETSVVGEGPFRLYQVAGTGALICR
jgi:hypothetical protein